MKTRGIYDILKKGHIDAKLGAKKMVKNIRDRSPTQYECSYKVFLKKFGCSGRNIHGVIHTKNRAICTISKQRLVDAEMGVKKGYQYTCGC